MVEAAPLQCVVQFAGAVGGEHDQRRGWRRDRADLDEVGTGKSCKRMADVGFGEVDGTEDDLRAAWRARLEREGKLSNGGTVADLVLGPAQQG